MERVPHDLYTPIYDDITIECLKKEFSRLSDEHYLDHAGATLYSETQMKRVSNDMLNSLYGNPHSAGTAGNLTHEIIERTRHRLLDHFHASPEEYHLVFTSGATGALKTVAESFRFATNDEDTGSFVYLQDNHTSVLGMRDLVSQRGAKVSCLSHEKAFEIFSNSFQSNNRSSRNDISSLFVYPAQCNFTGLKYPLQWISMIKNGILESSIDIENSGRWYVLLDAAAFVGTNDLNLALFKPDFVALSFYKMFGYPTGTGALLVKKSSADVLEKTYYGGGTVNLALSLENFHVKRDAFHERFEDGTLSFLSIIALQHGLNAMSIASLHDISRHVFSLARYLHHSLISLRHKNGKQVARIYSDTNYEDYKSQGGIVAFNLLRSNGEYVGYTEVINMAAIFKIYLRTGCFCNPGACQRQLRLTNQDVMNNYEAGYTCGGSRALIDGRPTGAVRISFGYMSTPENVEAVLVMINECFVDGSEIRRISNTPSNLQYTLEKSSIAEIIMKNISLDDSGINNRDDFQKNDLRDVDNHFGGKSVEMNNQPLKVSKLFIYPIKSCAAYEITDSWLLGERGLQYDREWMIVTSAGVCLSQKQQVNLCLLKPKICREKNALILNYPGMPSVELPLDLDSQNIIESELCRSRVCGHRVEGIDCGSEISEWLSLALGRPNLRLIKQNDTKDVAKDSNKLTFSSQAQYLLINEASVQWIIDKLPEDSDCCRETILHRFRGNIILHGSVQFQEKTWSQIQIGKHKFQVDGPCTRCQMVCIDQTTGRKTVEPLRLIAEEFHGKLHFGIYLSRKTNESAIINVGDRIITT